MQITMSTNNSIQDRRPILLLLIRSTIRQIYREESSPKDSLYLSSRLTTNRQDNNNRIPQVIQARDSSCLYHRQRSTKDSQQFHTKASRTNPLSRQLNRASSNALINSNE